MSRSEDHWTSFVNAMSSVVNATQIPRRRRMAFAFTWWWLLATIGALLAAAWLFPTRAHGDSDLDPWLGSAVQASDAMLVCRLLDRNPTEDGVVGVVQSMVAHGISARGADDTLFLAVHVYCTQYLPVTAAAQRDAMIPRETIA